MERNPDQANHHVQEEEEEEEEEQRMSQWLAERLLPTVPYSL